MSDATSLLQRAEEEWRAFSWKSTLEAMDAVLTASKEAKDKSLNARKQLSEQSKSLKRQFKSLEQASKNLQEEASPENVQATVKAVDSVSKECRMTVKSYQEEIDQLSRRCKTAETSHAQLAQSLSELSDPAALIASASEQIQAQTAQMNQLLQTVEHVSQELQNSEKQNANYKKEIASLKTNATSSALSKEEKEELIQLRREVTEYEVEFRSLKNQDITIRKLEARIAELQTQGEEQLKEVLEKHKEELTETEGRRASEALEREAAMERKVQALELQLKAERAGRDAVQEHLLEADEGSSQREAAWEAQRQILVDDATRLRESLHTVTRERDELRLRMSAVETDGRNSLSSPPPSTGVSMSDLMAERKAYEAEVSELSETITMLRDELRKKDEAFSDEKRSLQTKIDALEREKDNLHAHLQSMETQLASAPSEELVNSMRHELRILKRLEYNANDVDAEDDPEIAGGNDDKDLESVLVSKLRRSESELVNERMSRNELQKQIESLQQALDSAVKAKDEADHLIASLEQDLAHAIATPAAIGKSESSPQLHMQENASTLQSVLDPDASAPTPAPPSPAHSMSLSEKKDDDHSVVTIIMAQRDRLRARCESLEAERDSFKRELQIQVQNAESLKADNTKLYEKVRYLQNYNSGKTSGSLVHRHSSLDQDLDLEALEQRYEASVDPFRQFSKAERQRKLNEMSPMERTVFIVAKTVLSTKEMRTALFFYVISLHFMVFITTYHWSHADKCQVDHDYLAHLPPPLPADHEAVVGN